MFSWEFFQLFWISFSIEYLRLEASIGALILPFINDISDFGPSFSVERWRDQGPFSHRQ